MSLEEAVDVVFGLRNRIAFGVMTRQKCRIKERKWFNVEVGQEWAVDLRNLEMQVEVLVKAINVAVAFFG